MITSLNEFKKKLDKPGKEDIDINNDGKVDKSDFYLLNKRRKIATSIKDKKKKKTNENSEVVSNYNKAMDLFYMANTVTFLMDEGYLTDELQYAEGVELNTINAELLDNEMGSFQDDAKFIAYIAKFQKLLEVYSTFNESVNINEHSGEDSFPTSGNRLYNILSGSRFEKWYDKDFVDHIEGTEKCKTKLDILDNIHDMFK